jgi:hypothetical protein
MSPEQENVLLVMLTDMRDQNRLDHKAMNDKLVEIDSKIEAQDDRIEEVERDHSDHKQTIRRWRTALYAFAVLVTPLITAFLLRVVDPP